MTEYRNRVKEYRTVASADLVRNALNFRRHPEHQRHALRGLLETVGRVAPLLAYEVDGELRLIDGHARLDEAAEWDVAILDIDADEAATVLAMLDKIGADAEIDSEALIALLDSLPTEARQTAGAAWSDDELAALIGDAEIVPGDGGDEFDPTPEEQGETRTALGDLWIIGGVHRLLVGDCTDAANVARLMGGELAECMWSDPPYGVDYTGKDPKAMKIENDGADDLPGLLCAAFGSADAALRDGAAVYIAHPPGARYVVFGNAFLDQGWRIHQSLVWLKNSMVLGHSDYHYIHEPILFGYKPGEGRGGNGWYGDNSQVSVFEVDRPQASHDHPTEKPLGLIEPMLQNSSARNSIVLDPFLGSGTTLIAAHRTGRRCYGCELSPRYADVILRRAEAEGLTVERAST